MSVHKGGSEGSRRVQQPDHAHVAPGDTAEDAYLRNTYVDTACIFDGDSHVYASAWCSPESDVTARACPRRNHAYPRDWDSIIQPESIASALTCYKLLGPIPFFTYIRQCLPR